MTDEIIKDAINAIQSSRDALADGIVTSALLHLVHANRYHALASGIASMEAVTGGAARTKLGDVSNQLTSLFTDVCAAVDPKRAKPREVAAVMRECLAPILRELATPEADPRDVVIARANNAAAILAGEFDIRKRTT